MFLYNERIMEPHFEGVFQNKGVQFQSPEEEVAFLREQLKQKEQMLGQTLGLPTTMGLYSFIGVAESINLAGELGRWVMRRACAEFSGWRSRGIGTDATLRLNVSPVQLVSEGFADVVAETLADFGLAGESVCLEITESLVVQDIETARITLAALKEVGVQIAIDDNGTGVPEHERDAVFHRFARGSTASHSGSGLGLALVAQQAELHGGTAHLSTSPLGGAQLVLRLAATSRMEPAVPARQAAATGP